MTRDSNDHIQVGSEFLLYAAPDGAVTVRVLFKDETVWLTQKALAGLFGVKVPAVAKHLKNIFDSGELQESSVVSILETTAADGKNDQTRFYDLDAGEVHRSLRGHDMRAGGVKTKKAMSVFTAKASEMSVRKRFAGGKVGGAAALATTADSSVDEDGS